LLGGYGFVKGAVRNQPRGFHYADVDLWVRMAAGAKVWHTGTVWHRDVFAFTPILPQWVDHEWEAGLIYFTVLRLCGPLGLMALKVALGILALWISLHAALRAGASYPAVFLLASILSANATSSPGRWSPPTPPYRSSRAAMLRGVSIHA